MSLLDLAVLGLPEVRHGGQPLVVRTRKMMALLCYLALEPGPHQRNQLVELLWPEADPAQGRNSLRTALVHLRTALDLLRPGEAEKHLHTTPQMVTLARVDLRLDLTALAEAAALADAVPWPSPVPAAPAVRAQLVRAMALCRGVLLEGGSFPEAPSLDAWLQRRREEARRQLGQVASCLAALQEVTGEAAAVSTLERWMVLDPTAEEALRRLMALQQVRGERAGALRAFEAYRTRLAADLDAEPEPATLALAAALRAPAGSATTPFTLHTTHVPALLAVPATPATPAAPRTPPPRGELLEEPLVGREGPLAQLRAAVARAQAGQAQAVVLVGEAGIGKSRLAAEFLAWAEAHGLEVLRGRTFEGAARLPYAPLVEALRARLERENAPEDLLEDHWLAELARLLPELRARYPDLPPPTADETLAQGQLFAAVGALGRALAARAPTVLFVDDVQWADTATRDLLRYALRGWASELTRLLVVLAVRVEDLGSSPELRAWLADLPRDVPSVRLEVGPLSEEATVRFVRGLAGPEAVPLATGGAVVRFGDWLYGETAGQPLFMVETLRALLEEGMLGLRREAGAATGWALEVPADWEAGTRERRVPAGVRALISGRLARVEEGTRALLAAGAVLGRRFSFRQLLVIAGLEEGAGLAGLDLAIRGRLLREGAVGYSFGHDLVREVVYEEAGAARRAVLHGRALALLEGDAAPAAELARHALAAGLLERAVRHSLAAGNQALAVFAATDAITMYEQAVQTLPQLRAPLGTGDVAQIYANLGRAHELVDGWDHARTVYEALHAYGAEHRVPALQAEALNRLALLAAQRYFDLPAAIALLEEAMATLSAGEDHAPLAETRWNLAQMLALSARPAAAIQQAEEVLALARGLGADELAARCLYVLSSANLFLNAFEEAAAWARAAEAAFTRLEGSALGSPVLALQFVWAGAPTSGSTHVQAMRTAAQVNLTCAEYHRGAPHAAVVAGRAAVELAVGLRNPALQAFAGINLVPALLDIGAYDEALQVAARACAIGRTLPTPVLTTTALSQLALVRLHYGDLAGAATFFAEAYDAGATDALRPWRHIAVIGLATTEALRGAWDAAARWAQEAIAYRSLPGLPWWVDFRQQLETQALVRVGREDLARAGVAMLAIQAGHSRRYRVAHLRSLAVLALHHGKSNEAKLQLHEARSLVREFGLLGEEWQIEAELAAVYCAQGMRAAADEVGNHARTIVQGLAERIADADLRASFLASAFRQLG